MLKKIAEWIKNKIVYTFLWYEYNVSINGDRNKTVVVIRKGRGDYMVLRPETATVEEAMIILATIKQVWFEPCDTKYFVDWEQSTSVYLQQNRRNYGNIILP